MGEPAALGKDYKASLVLRDLLKEQLHTRSDKKELMGLAATQLGIPARAVYIEHESLPNDGSLFLVNPTIHNKKEAEKTFMLKLVKCPNSPVAYNLSIFPREYVISSDNAADINMTSLKEVQMFDPTLDLSANLQRIIWASVGIIPGNPDSVPMNYINISNVLETSNSIKKKFKCYVRVSEIQKIINKFERAGELSLNKNGGEILINNLLSLLVDNVDKEWIKVPSLNLFYGSVKKDLYVN